MKLLQSLVVLIGCTAGLGVADQSELALARERRQANVTEPNAPPSGDVEEKQTTTTVKPAETTGTAETGGASASTTTEAKGEVTTDGDHKDHDHKEGEHDKSSAAVAGATACLLTTLFSL